MSKKEIARSFLRMVGTGEVRNAYDRYVAPSFIHHNQYFKGDRQSLLTAMEDASKKSPDQSVLIKQIFEDGNTVIAHSHVTRKEPAEFSAAVVHIFRFEGDRIVELWDLGQLISKDSPNENGMF